MKISRRFTRAGSDALASVQYEQRTSRIANPDGSVVFEMNDAQIPQAWSQLATDIMVSKYFRKAGVPQRDEQGNILRDGQGKVVTGPERSAKEVVHRLAGCWRHWGQEHGYFDSDEDGQAFYDELAYMLLHQMAAPNSPQWFNTGLNWAYGITGPSQGHFYIDPHTGKMVRATDAYTHPQPHACQPYDAPVSTPQGPMPIGKIVEQNLVGLEILDGTEQGSGVTRVVAVARNGTKPVLRVVLEDGTTIEATPDHKIYVPATGGLGGRWVRVDGLERGMCLVRIVRDRQAEAALARKPQDDDADGNTAVRVRTLKQVPIKRIESAGMHAVFDIQTESGQYLSNHVIVHNCFIQSVSDDLVNDGGIMDLWTREARLFKYGSGTGSNFSKLRGEDEKLSGGGRSSGLMSFLKIGDRAAGAIKSGGTTRRAAKMVCLDLDHPDIESFVNWKVREELKVAALAEGIKHLPADQRELAQQLGLKLDYDFNGEAYMTVSGQNSNNSVRIPNRFFKAVADDGEWKLTYRTSGKTSRSLKARKLWDEIAFAAWRCADPGVQYDDTINQWHTCPRSGRINASNPCVTGDTRILTPGGIWRRIDQMIHLPARVITNLHGQEIHVTDGAFPTGIKDVVELRTVGGYSVKLTADHQVWTASRGWVAAKDLNAGDEVRLVHQPAAVTEVGEPHDSQFFQLLGLFFSSANGSSRSLRLDRCLGDTDLAQPFARYIARCWQDSSAGRYGDEDDARNDSEECGSVATATVGRRLQSRLIAFVRRDASGLRLSDETFTAGLAAQRHLLRGLFSADGFIADGVVQLQHTDAGLLQDVQMVLLGFGIQSALQTQALMSSEGGALASGGSGASVGGSGASVNASGGLPNRHAASTAPEHGARVLSADGLRDGGNGSAPRSRGTAVVEDSSTVDQVSNGQPSTPQRHGLRIDPGSLRSFAKHVGFLPGRKADQLARLVSLAIVRRDTDGNWDRVASLLPAGRQQVFDLTEPVTHSFIANGITVHNCSEYMFLDDTACNLASLNVLTFFDPQTRRFDIDAYRHATRLWTIVLEISVLMASFPSEQIAQLSYNFRTLGLGFANLGAMLMQAGIPYDSDEGRAICAALSSILTGDSYATSAEMAGELGTFPGYAQNQHDMLRVIRNHRRAAYDVAGREHQRHRLGDYEGLDVHPVGMDANRFTEGDPLSSARLYQAATECWDLALSLGEKHGYRNAQTTVIAPTGTIGLLMDCDTTGVEPDFALIKFKKLSGGGYFKIANQSLRPALENLRYSPEQIHDILRYVMGTMSLHDAPHINAQRLKQLGFTDQELEKIEQLLPGQFEISFAFSPWSLADATLERLHVTPEMRQAPGFNLLRHLGFTRKQIDQANDVICGRGTVEGAPHLKAEHLPVFDCANKCGKHGSRYIAVEGHIRMMAAAQPFITGAISKTINLPHEATVDDIKSSYELSWKLGLKANALYRDGSKLSQPLNVKSDAELDEVEADDEENVAAAKEEVATQVVAAAVQAASAPAVTPGVPALATAASAAAPRATSSDNLRPAQPHTIERIIERIVERPLRRRLPDTRRAITHKFDVAGHEGYITVGLYDDGSPGEMFITMAKEGSTVGGLMDTIATLVSVSLQYGVPVDSLVRKFEHVRFEPSGMTRNSDIPFAKSLVDYIFRWMAMEFVPGYRATNAPQRTPAQPQEAAIKKVGNGHGPRVEKSTANTAEADAAAQDDASDALDASPHSTAPASAPHKSGSNGNGHGNRLALAADPLSQQGSEMQADAPACDVCGSITVRSGTCYKCLNCGNSMGCS